MPSMKPGVPESGEKRTTFRPPWVKDGPPSLPAPPPGWMGKQQQQDNQPKPVNTFQRPKLKEVKNVKISLDGDVNKPSEVQSNSNVQKVTKEKRAPSDTESKPKPILVKKDPSKPKEGEAVKRRVEIKQPDMAAPPPPPPPPSLPPPPPPPPVPVPPGFSKPPLTVEKAAKIDALRSRPRRRPDWVDMMKEVETGIKLKHIQCNDRSAPVLPKAKAKGQFVYDSEKQNAHNLLLKEIQFGVSLKKTKTNDRSKPILDGLRKFRRQMTIEEQIQKSASVADVVAAAAEPDELDDIDKVRDDLQSTKQMLAQELRNKEALERENKRLMARLLNLEVELEKEKLSRKIQSEGGPTIPVRTAEDEKLIAKLKEEAAESNKITKEMEEKYHKTAEELDYTRAKLESAWLRNTQLEMEVKSKGFKAPLTKQPSAKKLSRSSSNVRDKINPQVEEESESEGSESETEGEYEDEEPEVTENELTAAEKAANREMREHKMLISKLKTYKEKRAAAVKEKKNLKSQLNKLQQMLKEEKKKYKVLHAEVDKMAKLMKDVDDEESEEDDEEEKEEDETESESEAEEDESTAEESDGDVPETSTMEEKMNNLNKRIKFHEDILTRTKKGNYLLKANIDRRQDDLNRQKEMAIALQEDLNAVLSELG